MNGFQLYLANRTSDLKLYEGQPIHIQKGQTLVIDSTRLPILGEIIVEGFLTYDNDVDLDDYYLDAQNIIIKKGGRMEIGNEINPFYKKLTITLHGSQHLKDTELNSLGGNKGITVEAGGKLDLHGVQSNKTWAYLEEP